jgi:membrane protease YdiL (CAAX protease family)
VTEVERRNSQKRSTVMLLAIIFEGGLIVLAFLGSRLLGRPSLELIRPSWQACLVGLVATIPLLPPVLWLSHSKWPPFRRLMHEVEQTLVPLFSRCTTLDFALIAILAGLGEEVLFRGLIQTSIAASLGLWTALAITSVLFGLLHLVTRTYAVIATIFGAYLGWLYIATGDLFVAVVTHSVYDFVALNYLVLTPTARRSHSPYHPPE